MSHPSVATLLELPFIQRAVGAAAGAFSRLDSLPPLLRKALLLYAYAALTVLWAVAVVRRLRPGMQRLAATLPVLVGNLVAPLLLEPDSEPLLITPVAGVFSLAAFKLLAFAISRGPLVPGWLSPLQFCGVYILPIVPIQVFTVGSSSTAQVHTVKQGRQLLMDAWASTGTAMLVSWVLALPGLPVMVRHWLYTLASATFLTGVFDLLGAVAYLGLGITAAPTFDKPWLCDSFQDFWARRWNLTTTYMMRVLVYEPVIEGRMLPPGSSGRGSRSKAAAEAAAAAPTVLASSPGRRPPPTAATAAAAGGTQQDAATGAEEERGPDRQSTSGEATAPPPAAPDESQFKNEAAAGPTAEADEPVNDTGLRKRRRSDVPPSTAEQGNGSVDATEARGTTSVAAAAAAPGAGGSRRAPVPKLRRFLGLQAVFLFSGLWHILIFWYNTHVFSWRWCAFFAIQAPILMVERLVWQVGKRMGIRVPHFLQVFAANFLLIAVARPLFFGPTDTTGFAARNLAVGQAPLWALAGLTRRLVTRI